MMGLGKNHARNRKNLQGQNICVRKKQKRVSPEKYSFTSRNIHKK